MKRVLKSESSMSGDDGVKIGEKIVEEVQIYEMSESGETSKSGTQ